MLVHLIRHTRPAIDTGICYGRLDVELAPTSAADIATSLRDIPAVTSIISSPAIRCRTLAQALARRDDRELRIDERLSELDFGEWEGKAWQDISRTAIDAWADDVMNHAPGNGESLATMWRRVGEFREQFIDPRGVGRLAIIAHHGSLRALAAQLAGESPEKMFTRQWPWGFSRTVDWPDDPPAPLRPI